MKKIAYVVGAFPVLSETFIGNEIRAMQARGHEVDLYVFALRDGPAQPDDFALAAGARKIAGLPLADAPALLLRRGPAVLSGLAYALRQQRLPLRSLLFNALKLAAAIHRSGASHVHAHFAGGAAAHAIVAARMAGLPVSFTCHGHDVYAEPEDLPLKLASADRVVAVCHDLADDLAAMTPDARIAEIACGTNPARFTPRPADAPDNGRMLFVGRLVPQKGIDDLFAALATLPSPPPLDIVGDGPLRDQLETTVRAMLGADIRFLGPRDAAWLKAAVPAYRALVAPFKTGPDGARDTGPLVVKEAMAMGLPVVSTAYMGVKETVPPEAGFLVPPGDPAALAAALRTLLAESDADRRARGVAGRAFIESRFTLARQAEQLSAMVEAA